MFEEIGRLGERAAGFTAEGAVIAAGYDTVAAQKSEQILDGANQIAAENSAYAQTLRELGQAIGFSTVMEQLDSKMRHAPGLGRFKPHSAELSWVPSAAAMTDETGSPKDGVRAIYGWRTHWYDLSQERPPEAAITLFSQQHNGEVLPPQATVFGYDPVRNDAKGSREFVDLLAKGSFLFENYSRLRKLAEVPYEQLSDDDRLSIIAGTRVLKQTIEDGGPEGREYVDLFNLLSSHLREVAARDTFGRERCYKSAVWSLTRGEQFTTLNAQYEEEGYRDSAERFPRYTSDQLVAINALFAQPVLRESFMGCELPAGRTWKSFAAKRIDREEVRPGGPATTNAWPLPDVSVLNPVIEQKNIAERLQKIILSRPVI